MSLILTLFYHAAGQLGLSFSRVKDCIESGKGVELLGKSVERTQSLGVE